MYEKQGVETWPELSEQYSRAYSTNDKLTCARLESQAIEFAKRDWDSVGESDKKLFTKIDKAARLGLRQEFGKLVDTYARKSQIKKDEKCPKCGQVTKEEEAHACKAAVSEAKPTDYTGDDFKSRNINDIVEGKKVEKQEATRKCPQCDNPELREAGGEVFCPSCGYKAAAKAEKEACPVCKEIDCVCEVKKKLTKEEVSAERQRFFEDTQYENPVEYLLEMLRGYGYTSNTKEWMDDFAKVYPEEGARWVQEAVNQYQSEKTKDEGMMVSTDPGIYNPLHTERGRRRFTDMEPPKAKIRITKLPLKPSPKRKDAD